MRPLTKMERWTFVAAGSAIGLSLWLALVPPETGSEPIEPSLLVLGTAVAAMGGRLVASVRLAAAPGLVVAGAAVVALTSGSDLVGSGPLGGPFGYANATGAFFCLAAIAAMMAGAAAGPPWRAPAALAAAVFVAIVFATASLAAAVLVLTAPAAALGAARLGGRRAGVAIGGALFALTLSATVALGALHSPGPAKGEIDLVARKTLTDRRLTLWHEAILSIGKRPWRGWGIGGFAQASATARVDPDARWAHNEFLNVGVDAGILAGVFLVLMVSGSFGILAATAGGSLTTVLAAAALAAVGSHASIDYVLHFPAVSLTAAWLVGAGTVASP